MTIATGMLMAITLAGALLAVGLRNILHAVFGLAVSLMGVAGLFLVLGSPFVAAMEVLIYVGGISIAMVFVVMLSSVEKMKTGEPLPRKLLGVVAAGALASVIAVVIHKAGMDMKLSDVGSRGDWSVHQVGADLLDRYNLVFEALSVVLLLAIIGAILIARRDEPGAAAADGTALADDPHAGDPVDEDDHGHGAHGDDPHAHGEAHAAETVGHGHEGASS